MARWLETLRRAVPGPGQGGRLPVRRVPARPPAGQRAARLRPDRDRRGGARRAAASTWPTLRDAGGRAGPGQRRPRPARRLLHRLAGHHERPVRRLRHPLRVRHLPADLRRRPAGRAARLLAGPRLAVGVPAPRDGGQSVDFGGHTEHVRATTTASTRSRWVPGWEVIGVPYNYMVPGYQNGRVNTLRLWSAGATQAFDLRDLQRRRLRCRPCARRRSRRTSPRCSTRRTPPRRARSCGCSSSTSSSPARSATSSTTCCRADFDLRKLPERVIFQLNDTHPVIAHPRADADPGRREGDGVGRGLGDHPAVLRLHLPHPAAGGARGLAGRAARPAAAAAPGDHLPDQRGLPGRAARALTRTTSCGSAGCRSSPSTPSGRSGWPTWPPSPAPRSTAWPSCTASCCGTRCCPTSPSYWPDKFTNVTNGVTPRRFIRLANPALSELITDAIGDGWLTDLERLRELEPYAEDDEFRDAFREVKAANKRRLADAAASARRHHAARRRHCST